MMKQKKIRKIKSLKDLHRKIEKNQIKAQKLEYQILNNLSAYTSQGTTNGIISGVLDRYGMNSELLTTILPLVIKYRTQILSLGIFKKLGKASKRNLAIAGLGCVGAGLVAFLLHNNRKESKGKRKATKTKKPEGENLMFI